MSLEDILRIAQMVVTVASAALSVWLYVRSADRATVTQLRKDQTDGDAALAGRLGGLHSELRLAATRDSDFHTRLSILETKMAHVPTHSDLMGIRNEMKDLNETIAAVNERSETTQEMVHSIHRYLLENGRK
jgi:hypothetical protein